MKLYIWEGDSISDAYHDDGTLVVLAESPEQAREVARKSAADHPDDYSRNDVWRDAAEWRDAKATQAAIDRDPDRVLDIDTPCVVAFNGGGYD